MKTKATKATLFIFLIIMAQAIVGYLEYRYLSLTLGLFAIILIIFVQGLQMILEYNIFNRKIRVAPKLFYGIVIIAIMMMNINYLELSRKMFDDDDLEIQKDKIYQEELKYYNEQLSLYAEELEAYKKNIGNQKELTTLNYESEVDIYNSLMEQYQNQKTFLEKQITELNKRINTLGKSLNKWKITDEEKTKVNKEIESVTNQKNKLIDNYNGLILPEPPKREKFEIKEFTKERPIKPNKNDITLVKDIRLEMLYWLIAAILELGSFALLFLLNQTLNLNEKIISDKIKISEEEALTVKEIENVSAKKQLKDKDKDESGIDTDFNIKTINKTTQNKISKDNNKQKFIDNTENNNVIYVYKESEREKLIQEAIQIIRNMTIEERKILSDKLSKDFGKPISYKTLGVWVSRNYIPTKKIDSVLKIINQTYTEIAKSNVE